MQREARPLLCYVTDRRGLSAGGAAEDLLARIRSTIRAGVDWVQVREKDLATRPLLELARQAVAAAQGTPARVLINDRLDVALAAHAGGLHLGGESPPVAVVRGWGREPPAGKLPEGFLIGASCHSVAEAIAAERAGTDYIFFGPVFATPSKSQYGSPQGVERLQEVCRAVRIAVLAIGGITLENAGECLRAGAAGIAAIRLFQEASDLAAVVAELKS